MAKPAQILNILQVTAFLGLVATGQTLALLTGGIDLSVAGVVTMTNIVATGVMMGENSRIAPAVLVCLGLGAAVGALNGALIAILRVAPIIATLAMNSILFGAALVYTGGAPHGICSARVRRLGQGSVVGLPASALCWLVVAVAWRMRCAGRPMAAGSMRSAPTSALRI